MAPAPSQKFRAPQSRRVSAPFQKTPPQNLQPPSAPSAANQKSVSSRAYEPHARSSANSTNLPASACQSQAALSKKVARRLRQPPPTLSQTSDTARRPSRKS